jgi:hypothetical protein
MFFVKELTYMQQAKQTNRTSRKDPAGNPLKVVFSITQMKKEEESSRVKETEGISLPKAPRAPKTHYGRNYHPDGPSGNYQGL